MSAFLRVVLCVSLLTLVAGCYNTPVRHLSSDVVLIQVGTSTRDDVLLYLGEPDKVEIGSAGTERWHYKADRRSLLEGAPWFGKYIGTPEVSKVLVTLNKDKVASCMFTSSDKDDLDWQDDFKWQEELAADATQTESASEIR
ncbi:hypothetical protein [Desulfotalea psychrophila]|uniref:hypothetical protein n=1 Tax=Desulfotalea psychrophila TaxID=84980 RepID=UPI00059D935A|nr:hypothetical protein [Desulfotalea psychrophila]